MMNSSIIRIENISKSFGSGHSLLTVLEGLSAEIEPNSFNVFFGRSGSGKSTLLNLIAGLEKPNHGFIEILGKRVTDLTLDQLAEFRLCHMGIVFQFFNLLPTLSIEDNVGLTGHLKGLNASETRKRVHSALEKVGLLGESRRMPHEASGGEIQRAAIARSLVSDPDVILADEPTGNLDAKNREAVAEIFKNLVQREKKTVLMVTHDTSFESLADRVFRIENGRLVS